MSALCMAGVFLLLLVFVLFLFSAPGVRRWVGGGGAGSNFVIREITKSIAERR